jgi:hypothetical protein
VSAEHITD